MQIKGWETSITAFQHDKGLRMDAEAGALLDNKFVIAGMKYLGLKNPILREKHDYNPDGSVYWYHYIITDESNELLDNMNSDKFCHISVDYLEPEKTSSYQDSSISFQKIEPEEIAMGETVSYEDALEYVQEKYADEEILDITAEVYYESHLDDYKYIPCYRFVVETADEKAVDNAAKNIVYIPMTEIE